MVNIQKAKQIKMIGKQSTFQESKNNDGREHSSAVTIKDVVK
jgi:hypothetical protein